jgi:hypothetical protein
MEAANERKMAALGATEDETTRLGFGSELSDRAVFGGFDIGYDELTSTSIAVGDFYAKNTHSLGLHPLFVSCWCDGLLTGLLLASLPPTSDPGNNTGAGGGNSPDPHWENDPDDPAEP